MSFLDVIRGLLALACFGVGIWCLWTAAIELDWPWWAGVLLTGLSLLWFLGSPKADREAEREEAELELIKAATRRLEQDGDIDEETLDVLEEHLGGRRGR